MGDGVARIFAICQEAKATVELLEDYDPVFQRASLENHTKLVFTTAAIAL